MRDAIDKYIERLQTVVDELTAAGAEPVFVVAALTEVTVKTALLDRDRADRHLHNASNALAATAQNLRIRL